MIVTVDTLNENGFAVSAKKEDEIELLVDTYEREYFDLCLTEELSEVFTDSTKDDTRFTALRESSILDDTVYFNGERLKRVKGLDYGVNAYIYFQFIVEQFRNSSASGVTVLDPSNSVRIDPNKLASEVFNKSSYSAAGVQAFIEENADDYEEVGDFQCPDTRSFYNF